MTTETLLATKKRGSIKEDKYEEIARIILSEDKTRTGILNASNQFHVSIPTMKTIWYSLKMKPYKTKVEREIKEVIEKQGFTKEEEKEEDNNNDNNDINSNNDNGNNGNNIKEIIGNHREEISKEEVAEALEKIDNTSKIIKGFLTEVVMKAKTLELENRQLILMNKQLAEEVDSLLEIKKDFDILMKHLSKYN
jgi:hypothetical protein